MARSKDQQKLLTAFLISGIWVILLVGIHLLGEVIEFRTRDWGILPRHIPGLTGILSSPLIHGSYGHLFSNVGSLFFLAVGLFYFYRKISLQVLLFIWLGSGLGTWLIGRSSIHIGASGVIYGLAFFLFFSGIFRKETFAIALSLVVVMFHGAMIWGMIPAFTEENISWEGHLFGAISGVLAAFFYRNQAQDSGKKYSWENEPDPEDDEAAPWNYKKVSPPPTGFEHPQ